MVGSTVTNEVVVPIMLQDIRSQGEVLARGLAMAREHASQLAFESPRRIVLTGSGDSFIAAAAVLALFQEHLGSSVVAVPSLDASRYLELGAHDLVVVLSVSGEVARTIEVAGTANDRGADTIAITAAPLSTLAARCDAVVAIPEPLDRSIPHSRDYTATLMALACALESLASVRFGELDAMPELTADAVVRSLAAAERLATAPDRTWFLGAGPDRATAMFGALKFWEAAGMEAWWDDLEEFGHGSQLMARPGDRVVVIAEGPGVQRAHEMIPGLQRMGLDVVTVGGKEMEAGPLPLLFTTDALNDRWHPFVSCVPLQALTFIEARARGLDVSIPLFGHAHGPVYDEVHVEWTKGSRVLAAGGGDPPPPVVARRQDDG
jgi:glutamine---fructose-6-phosphate transaminase (isomerizing)